MQSIYYIFILPFLQRTKGGSSHPPYTNNGPMKWVRLGESFVRLNRELNPDQPIPILTTAYTSLTLSLTIVLGDLSTVYSVSLAQKETISKELEPRVSHIIQIGMLELEMDQSFARKRKEHRHMKFANTKLSRILF